MSYLDGAQCRRAPATARIVPTASANHTSCRHDVWFALAVGTILAVAGALLHWAPSRYDIHEGADLSYYVSMTAHRWINPDIKQPWSLRSVPTPWRYRLAAPMLASLLPLDPIV